MIYGTITRLRRIERDDIPTFVRWFADPEVREFLLLNRPISIAEEEQWFVQQLQSQNAELFAIETNDGIHIGNIGLHDINWLHRSAEMGIVIGHKQYWGKGYGSDAIRTLLRFAFDEMNLHRVQLTVYEDNARAIRAYEKCGFRHEGRLRDAVYRKGRYYDMLLMSVLSGELQPGDEASGQ
ncbi:MAG: GNAT family N-acetyltransferase [Anaerolineae bacterium]|jgi:UDP-4-amino-4,6-dideoxy-N-acetyl-beta-L-altrosamine N-acetyltransferase